MYELLEAHTAYLSIIECMLFVSQQLFFSAGAAFIIAREKTCEKHDLILQWVKMAAKKKAALKADEDAIAKVMPKLLGLGVIVGLNCDCVIAI